MKKTKKVVGIPFLPGNQAAVGRAQPERPEKPEDVPCPEGLKARGLEGAWVDLVKQSKKGNHSATSKLVEWSKEFGGDISKADSDAVDHRYDGFPDEVADLLRELDMGIADVVHRYELGFVCEDIEILIAETAIAVREGGARCAAVQRWRRVAIEAVRKLEEQKGNDDESKSRKQGEGTGGVGATPPGSTSSGEATGSRRDQPRDGPSADGCVDDGERRTQPLAADRGGRGSASAPDSSTGAGDGHGKR